MWGIKDYICVCHGCGKFHVHQAYFLSSPVGIRLDVPNSDVIWHLPMVGCPECMSSPQVIDQKTGKPDRTKHPISRAYDSGMTPEARERTNKEFPEWLPRLEQTTSRV